VTDLTGFFAARLDEDEAWAPSAGNRFIPEEFS
jgi:hypothetical protein